MAGKKNKKELSSEEKLVNKIGTFFSVNKKIIIFCAAVLLFAALVIIIVSSAVSGSKDKAMIRVADLEEQVNAFVAEDSTAENHSAKYTELVDALSKEVKGKAYPSVKAEYLLGLIYYSEEDWNAAQEAFYKAYELNSGIYLAPIALVNAAASAEAAGDTQTAIDLYNRAVEYETSGVGGKALFNVGRIYMQQGNTQLAAAVFNQLLDNYSGSQYAALAENLLLVM